MIPPLPAADAPGSEKRVFYALKAAPGTEKWTILHSLGISSSWTGEFGEIDFVIIIPDRGVICAEVKGGRVTQKEGTWFTQPFGSDVQERLKRSPFSQAQRGMWKLDKALDLKFGPGSWESRCLIGWMVILPDVDCPPVTPEFTRDEVIDQRDMAADFAGKIPECPVACPPLRTARSVSANRRDLSAAAVLPEARFRQDRRAGRISTAGSISISAPWRSRRRMNDSMRSSSTRRRTSTPKGLQTFSRHGPGASPMRGRYCWAISPGRPSTANLLMRSRS